MARPLTPAAPAPASRSSPALRLVGVSFLLLAAWVPYESGGSLWLREPPSASWL